MPEKKVKIVTLEGNTVEEIEVKATTAVNEGGTVIGQGVVLIEGNPIPALVIIRRAPVVVDVNDDLPEDEVMDTEQWMCPVCGNVVQIRFDPGDLGAVIVGQSCSCGRPFDEGSWTCVSPLDG